MFILDTNVLSELRRLERAHPSLATWAQSNPVTLFFLSAITIVEIELGTALIERRDKAQGLILRAWIDGSVLPRFRDRILPVDTDVALRAAHLHLLDPKAERDGLIAATALVHGMTVVTRNVGDFAPTGVKLLNPWDS